MPPTTPTPVTVYVRERGRAPTSHPTNGTLTSVAYYDMVTIPSEPVRVGAYLKIKTLREVPTPFAVPQRYSPEEPGVEGTVVSLRAMDREVVEFVVKNGVPWSTTEFAFLAAPHIPGITTRLTIVQWILHFILCTFLMGETRRIPNLPRTAVDDEREG
ncbi:hypothetical protein C2E23DRAFT_861420 [Lenzites betulinus]|nr:hypothetical protein C2E23DRAFT_861420 [Lenzites betulinus]